MRCGESTNINKTEMFKEKLEYRIMAAFAVGYRLNMAFYKTKTNKYDTSYAQNVGIKRDSFLTLSDKMHKQILYNELSCINGKFDMNIVSVLPKKSIELAKLLI